MKRILSITKNLWSFAFLMLMVTPVFGQVIFTNPIDGANPSADNPFTTGQIVDPNVTVSGIGRGSGVNGVAVNGSYAARDWNSVDFAAAVVDNDYFEWTITPDAGNFINFQDLVINLTRNNIDFGTNVVLRSSADGFTTDIYAFDFVSNSSTISLAASMFQNVSGPISFRIYAWGAPANRNLRVNSFTFNGSTPGIFYNPITGTNPGQTNPYTTGELTNPNISVSGIGRGTGTNGANGNNAYNTSSWNTPSLDPDAYFEWVVTPNAGFEIDFRNFVVSLRTNNVTLPNELGNNIVLRSSVDGFVADVETFTLTNTVNNSFTVDLTDISFQNINSPITFRIYAWGADTAGRTLRVNDFNFSGTVNVIPGPPVLNTTAPSPLVFDPLTYGVASSSQTVQVYGLNPTTSYPATVIVNALPNIEVSNDNINWGPSTTLTLTSPSQVPLYVRMVPLYFGDQLFSFGIDLSSPSFAPSVAFIDVQGNVTIPAAPVATAATNITSSSFDANWNPVPGATSYNLSVGVWGTTQALFEDFVSTNAELVTEGWLVSGCTNITSGVLLIDTSSLRFNVDGSRITTPAIEYPTEVSFLLKQVNSNVKSFTVQVSTISQVGPFTTLATYTQSNVAVSSPVALTVDLSAYENEPNVYIRFENTGTFSNNWSIDDIDVTARNLTFVSPYDGLNVGSVTTYTVSGLTDFTEYVYFVDAQNNVVTPFSNVIDVTTARLAVTWDGTAWSNVIGPDLTKDAIIDGDYDTSVEGSFSANSLTVNASNTLTITAGEEVVLADAFVNNGTAANVVVNSNGNLVQNAIAPVNTGSITVRRDTQALMRLDYVAWSSPVIAQNLLSFSPQTLTNRFYTYNTTTNLYQTIDPAINTFSGATGYLVRLPNNHPLTPTVWTGEFTGVPNTGTINHTMANIGTGQRFNLVGNPYPSAVELAKFTTENNTAITGTLYFWRKTNGDPGSAYVTYAGGVWSNASSDQNINVGQGFLVEALTGQTNVRFTNAMRSVTNGTSYKTSQEIQTEERNTIWLTLKKDNVSVAYLAVGYATGATNGIENGKDAIAINDSEVSLTSLVDATDLAIQQRALPFVTTDEVALRFKSNVAGTYAISINQLAGLFTGNQNIYLKDVLTNVTHDLKLQDYTFTTVAGTFDDRFKIVYDNSTLGVDTFIPENGIIAYVDSKILNIESVNQTIENVAVYDISGRLVAQKSKINATTTELSLNGIAKQVLLVQISTDKGVVTKKIIF